MLFQDGVQSSRPPSESLQISEVEDTSDGDQTLSPRMDASGTDTRPNSGAVDVSACPQPRLNSPGRNKKSVNGFVYWSVECSGSLWLSSSY